jgi:hypothetical protein
MPQGKHPDWRALSVIFETETQPKGGRFSIPQDICNMLGVGPKDHLRLSIEGLGLQILDETRELISGVEILDRRLKRGTKIRVQASRVDA